MNLSDILDLDNLESMITEGYITRKKHPKLDIYILNYTSKAMWDNEWNNETMWCRGLIYEGASGDIVAMGPRKFFNYGQPGAIEVPLAHEVRVTNKLDGSLGIVWSYQGEYGVATRGSFVSEQAIHATKLLMEPEYETMRNWDGDTEFTTIVEIIYPENRIVLNYGEEDSLRSLGSVKWENGVIAHRTLNLIRGSGTLEEALTHPIPDDEEGYVLDILSEDGREVIGHVKLKGETYKALHYIMTGMSARKIWEMMLARFIADSGVEVRNIPGVGMDSLKKLDTSKGILEMLGDVPDEFSGWVTQKISSINSAIEKSVWDDIKLSVELKDIPDGRERFEAGKHNAHIGAILSYLRTGDATQIHIAAWKDARPGAELPFLQDEEG